MLIFRPNKGTIILATTIFSILLIGGLFFNMKNLQNQAKTNEFQRVYKENELKYVRAFEFKGYVPHIRYHNDKLYLNDFHNQQIVEVDTFGNTLNRFPDKKNNQLISDIRSWNIDENGIYIVDAEKNIFTHLDFNNSIVNQYNTNQIIVRAGFLESDLLLINTFDSVSMNSPNKFQLVLMILDTESKSKEQVHYPLPAVRHSAMKFNGFFVKNNNGRIFYVCLMAGLFYCVDSEGKFLYLAQTIDQTPLPKVLESNAGNTIRLDPLMTQVNLSAAADDQYLYILSDIHSKNEIKTDQRLVDVYNVIDGVYEFSFRIPQYKGTKPGRIAVAPDGFYFRHGDDHITYYSKDENHL